MFNVTISSAFTNVLEVAVLFDVRLTEFNSGSTLSTYTPVPY